MVKLNGLYSPTDSIKGFIPQMTKKECLVCDEKENLTKINGTNSQYDGSYICEGCLEVNENAYADDMRDQAIINSFGG